MTRQLRKLLQANPPLTVVYPIPVSLQLTGLPDMSLCIVEAELNLLTPNPNDARYWDTYGGTMAAQMLDSRLIGNWNNSSSSHWHPVLWKGFSWCWASLSFNLCCDAMDTSYEGEPLVWCLHFIACRVHSGKPSITTDLCLKATHWLNIPLKDQLDRP